MDRNEEPLNAQWEYQESLSARRAWIEITGILWVFGFYSNVALRKESVDRNLNFLQCLVCRGWSLSARRAWIEIVSKSALMVLRAGRSPQGERG